jgi:hypothetical protein
MMSGVGMTTNSDRLDRGKFVYVVIVIIVVRCWVILLCEKVYQCSGGATFTGVIREHRLESQYNFIVLIDPTTFSTFQLLSTQSTHLAKAWGSKTEPTPRSYIHEPSSSSEVIYSALEIKALTAKPFNPRAAGCTIQSQVPKTPGVVTSCSM